MKIIKGENWRIGCKSNVIIEGRISLIKKHSDLEKVQNGDILVAMQTDVNYAPQMLISSAIITEDGGRYSHAATFCRENKIPCIIGATGIMSELIDAQYIKLDTNKKELSIL